MDSADCFLAVFGYNLSDFNGCLLLHVFSTQFIYFWFLHTSFSLLFCLLVVHYTMTHWSCTGSSVNFFPHSFTLFLHSKTNTSAHRYSFPHLCLLCIAVVAGPSSSSSVPDGITDDVTLPSDQSSKPRGEATVQGNDDWIGQVVYFFSDRHSLYLHVLFILFRS